MAMSKEEKRAKMRARYHEKKELMVAQSRAYRANNKEKVKASQKAYYEANRERLRAQQNAARAENREADRERSRAYKKANPQKAAAQTARRTAAKMQRTPAWADKDAIAFAYHAAQVIADNFGGKKPHVDHIIPLQGERVSGLHVTENLQLLNPSDNMSKNNHF